MNEAYLLLLDYAMQHLKDVRISAHGVDVDGNVHIDKESLLKLETVLCTLAKSFKDSAGGEDDE